MTRMSDFRDMARDPKHRRGFEKLLLLAWGVCQLITTLAGITMTITIGYILMALIVSSGVGMLAGIYPAFKAARLDPIVALTHTT